MDIIKQIYIQLPQQPPTFFGTFIKSGSERRFYPADPRAAIADVATAPSFLAAAKERSKLLPFAFDPSLYRRN